MPENSLWMHPNAAKALQIKEGQWVQVTSKVGEAELRATLKQGIREDTVYMASGFGVMSKGLTNIFGKGACVADLMEDFADDLSGNMAMHETFVEVSKRGIS
jgi:thiosulfate reductase/polysulfide reductase chain A